MLNENFASVWEALADRLPEHDAIIQGRRRVTLGEWESAAARVAGTLSAQGTRPGDKVAMVLYNCPEFLEVMFAAFKLRAVPVAFNYRLRSQELREVLADSDSKVVVFHGAVAEELACIRDELPEVACWIQVPDDAPTASWAVPYAEALDHDPAPRVERTGSDQFIQYTGGTTGRPKGVVWRHADIAAIVSFLAYLPLGLDPPVDIDVAVDIAASQREQGTPGVYVPCVPLMHGSGLYASFSYLQVAGKVVLLEGRSFDAGEFCRTAAAEGATQTVIVGDVFAVPIADELERAIAAGTPHDLSTLTMLTSGGLTFSAEAKRRLMACLPNLSILDAVGGSEGGPWGINLTFAGSDPDDTGTFTASPETVLIDAVTREIMPFGSGHPGLIGFRGPLPVGYHKDDGKTAENFWEIDGVRYSVTGDFAVIDADGRMQLLGRGNTCINTGGEKVFPTEVESVIQLHPTVRDCVVVGVPDARWGQAVCAVVEPRADAQAPTLDELADHVKEHLAGYKQPRHVVAVDAVRRTAAGKQDYRWAEETARAALGM